MDSRILVPVRYAAWLSGELGRRIESTLRAGLEAIPDLRLTRMPRGFLVEGDEEMGPLVEATAATVRDVEDAVAEAYPVFHHEMGPLWGGTLQVLLPAAPRTSAAPRQRQAIPA